MNVKSIKYFLAICEDGTFTKAAAAKGISQPSLSLAIQRLESELGGALFRRTAHAVVLTELGNSLRPIFKKLVRCADQACKQAAALKRSSLPDKIGEVPVGVGPSNTRGVSAII
jgi:LysR family transcriptional regulator, hydrogen peroxide-inducible genes activator